MRIVVQRVKEAQVKVEGQVVGKIGKGVLVFFAVHKEDTPEKTKWLAQKLIHLRLFPDEHDKMNLSLEDVHGEVLIVSQFTLYGNCIEGRRPDFIEAAPPAIARPIYEKFIDDVKKHIPKVETGVFGAYMEVSLINDGPITFLIDTKH
jgi:D-tyrosyl-tRNA(Tyr) deacylase